MRSESGSLAGVLDFGDAFVGARAWDFALLSWSYGRESARAVSEHDAAGTDLDAQGSYLAVAVGLYKLAKDPTVASSLPRLCTVLDALG